MTVPPTELFGFQLQDLDCFRKDEFAINTLFGNIANHAVTCKELRKLLEGTSAAITDVVVAVIAECDSILRRVFGSVNVVSALEPSVECFVAGCLLESLQGRL